MSFTITNYLLILTTIFTFIQSPISGSPHVIEFKSPNLYPESITYDRSAQHFVVGSLRHPTLLSVSDAGITKTIVSDQSLPANSSFLGVTVDNIHKRLLAVVFQHSDPSNCGLAAYDLQAPHDRIFLTTLFDAKSSTSAAGANDVAVDFLGNAYVTNSASNLIWKVDIEGKASVLSESKTFTKTPVPDSPYSSCGLNGIIYCSKGYLIVSQSNTGNLYKVDHEDGTVRKISLNKELTFPDGVALRSDGVLLVVSQDKLYYIKSDNSWSDGVVYDETALDSYSFPTSVTVGDEDRAYVLYGHVREGILGNSQRERFTILEVRSADESGSEAVWVYILIGFGLVYFWIWRFQMRQLVTNMNKKVA
ncbi:NHL repeat-containing protein [Tanacetum coccineum]